MLLPVREFSLSGVVCFFLSLEMSRNAVSCICMTQNLTVTFYGQRFKCENTFDLGLKDKRKIFLPMLRGFNVRWSISRSI